MLRIFYQQIMKIINYSIRTWLEEQKIFMQLFH